MANHQSAIKRHKQSEKRRLRNASTKSTLRTAVKKVTEAVAAGKPEEAAASLKGAVKLLDKAVSKGVLHRNTASRKISRLTVKAGAPKK
ncbi:MAG TPA: 30S ribosomal protein S20 [Thermodesulfobacteriota bacterium]|nr:30S ribosomal protein S20 [Thermodesulfobacteriota bacterium]